MKNQNMDINTGLEAPSKNEQTKRKAKAEHASVKSAPESNIKLTKNEERARKRANKALRDAEKKAREAGDDESSFGRVGPKQAKKKKAREGHGSFIDSMNNIILHHSGIAYPKNIAEFCESLRIYNAEEGDPYPLTLAYCESFIRQADNGEWRYKTLNRVLKAGLIEPNGSVRKMLICYIDAFTEAMRDEAELKKYGHTLSIPERDAKAVEILTNNTTRFSYKKYR